LKDAIESALSQSYEDTEVVVVDDGSTDHSPEIIREYGDAVAPVLKENGGQAAAVNAGFAASRGDVILILDADDALAPEAAERAVERLRLGMSKVHWPLREMTEEGRPTGQLNPSNPLPEGDLRSRTIAEGPNAHAYPPTSGNAWARRFLEEVLPAPEAEYRILVDSYLQTLAPVAGPVGRIDEPCGYYRVHGGNRYAAKTAYEQNQLSLGLYDHQCAVLRSWLERRGLEVDEGAWKSANPHYIWRKRLQAATEKLVKLVPPGAPFVLIDDDQWDHHSGNREIMPGLRAIPFLERDGQYWGHPPDDATAIRECESLRRRGVRFLVVSWVAFWWLEHYSGFREYLESSFERRFGDEDLLVFDLSGADPGVDGRPTW